MDKNRWIPLFVAIVGAAIVIALYSFNQKPQTYEEYLVGNIAVLLWLPMVMIYFVFRQEPSSFGMGLGEMNRGYKLAGILFALMIPLLVIASRMQEFQNYYPIQKQAAHDWSYFAYFTLTYGMYLFCWEFFFRGFLLFGMSRLIGGAGSVFLQAVAFGILHIGKPAPEVMGSFIAGIILGVLALRSKSFVPCFALHWAVAFTFDLLIIGAKRGFLF